MNTETQKAIKEAIKESVDSEENVDKAIDNLFINEETKSIDNIQKIKEAVIKEREARNKLRELYLKRDKERFASYKNTINYE